MYTSGSTQVVVGPGELAYLKTSMGHGFDSFVQHAKEYEATKQHYEAKQAEIAKLVQEKAMHEQKKALLQASVTQKQANIAQGKENLDGMKVLMMAKLFLMALGKKAEAQQLDQSKASALVTEYSIADAMTLDIKTKSSQILSTSPFVQYLKAHSEVKTCDFRMITTVKDVNNFSQYLADSSCAVTAVVMKKGISQDEQDSLDAVALQKQIKVTYV